MKKLFTLALIIFGFSATSEAFAARVFKCVDAKGHTTFTFASCSTYSTGNESVQSYEYHKAELDIIENKISHLRRRSRDLRLEMKANLITDMDPKKRQEFLKDFKFNSGDITRQLAELKNQRAEHVESSMALLTQAY